MGFIKCIQGQAEGNRELLTPNLMSEELFQDILQCFRAQENSRLLLSPPQAEQLIRLFSGELAPFLPVNLGSLDWLSWQFFTKKFQLFKFRLCSLITSFLLFFSYFHALQSLISPQSHKKLRYIGQ